MEHKVSKTRHIAKTITWRIVGSSATFLIAYLMTGNFGIAGTIGVAQVVVNTLLYYVHERVWYKYIKIGLKDNKDAK